MSLSAILPPLQNRQFSTPEIGHFYFALIGHYHFAVTVRTKELTVEETVNGSMFISHNDVRLPFREITARPEKQHEPTPMPRKRKGHTPSPHHPWHKANRQFFYSMRGEQKKPMEATTS
jgi:hypothetical protein